MKRVLIVFFLLIFNIIQSTAQIEKKSVLLGGHASIGIFNNAFYLNIHPNSGMFITDHICIGASIPIVLNSGEFSGGIAPFGRYYFSPGMAKSLFASGSAGIIMNSFENAEMMVSLGIGQVWMLNKNLGFETELKLAAQSKDIFLGVQFGFQIYIDPKNLKIQLFKKKQG